MRILLVLAVALQFMSSGLVLAESLCLVCSRSLKSKSDLTKHHNEKHWNKSRLEKEYSYCPTCHGQYDLAGHKVHKRLCNGDKLKVPNHDIVCARRSQGCEFNTKIFSEYVKHIKKNHVTDPDFQGMLTVHKDTCSICKGFKFPPKAFSTLLPAEFKLLAASRSDRQIYHPEQPPTDEYVCPIEGCGKKFKTERLLNDHYNDTHFHIARGGEFYYCNLCTGQYRHDGDKVSRHRYRCNGAILQIPPHFIQCSRCLSNFQKFPEFVDHIKLDHLTEIDPNKIMNEHIAICDICGIKEISVKSLHLDSARLRQPHMDSRPEPLNKLQFDKIPRQTHYLLSSGEVPCTDRGQQSLQNQFNQTQAHFQAIANHLESEGPFSLPQLRVQPETNHENLRMGQDLNFLDHSDIESILENYDSNINKYSVEEKRAIETHDLRRLSSLDNCLESSYFNKQPDFSLIRSPSIWSPKPQDPVRKIPRKNSFTNFNVNDPGFEDLDDLSFTRP